VRSLILPKNGLPNMASRVPIPATSTRLSGARSIPRVQRDETPSDPVRRGRLGLQRILGRGSVLQSIESGSGRQMRVRATPETGNVGHCALLKAA
jgi:hypothetical protein